MSSSVFLHKFMVALMVQAFAVAGANEVLFSLVDEAALRQQYQAMNPAGGAYLKGHAGASQRAALIHEAGTPNGRHDYWGLLVEGLLVEEMEPGAGRPVFERLRSATRKNLAANWILAQEFASRGRHEEQLLHLQAVHRIMLEKGYMRLPELSKLMLHEAKRNIQAGAMTLASTQLDFSEKFDPFSPWVYLLRIEAHAKDKWFWEWDWGWVWQQLGELYQTIRFFDNQTLLWLNGLRFFRYVMTIFLLSALFAVVVHHFPRLSHGIAEKLPRQAGHSVRYVAIATILVSLLVLGVGWFSLGLLLTVLVWRFTQRGERKILQIYLLFLLMLPLVLYMEKSFIRPLDGQSGMSLYRMAYNRGWEGELEKKLQSYRPHDEADRYHHLLAGSLFYKKLGDFSRSDRLAREAVSMDDANPMGHLVLGNLRLIQSDFEPARMEFLKARQLNPLMWESWFNSSQVELFLNNSVEHKQLLDRAGELAPVFLTDYLLYNDEHFPNLPYTRKALDPQLRVASLWSGMVEDMTQLRLGNLDPGTGLLELPGTWLGLAALVAGFYVFGRYRRYSIRTHGSSAFECKTCGKVTCNICRKGVHCQRCFKVLTGVTDTKVRRELSSRIYRKARYLKGSISIGLDMVLPGAGRIYQGRGVVHLTEMLLASIFISAVYLSYTSAKEYPDFVLGSLRQVAWFSLAAFYLGAWAMVLKNIPNTFKAEKREV